MSAIDLHARWPWSTIQSLPSRDCQSKRSKAQGLLTILQCYGAIEVSKEDYLGLRLKSLRVGHCDSIVRDDRVVRANALKIKVLGGAPNGQADPAIGHSLDDDFIYF